uniref:Uncharacterized protein n=1 Tax=Anguilla anguilla TaxID=7936 RepID=A0A0E9URH4_ANGAN
MNTNKNAQYKNNSTALR